MELNTIAALAKSAPEVALEAYRDLFSPALKQTGRLGEQIVKAARLVLFPVQIAAVLQDRLDDYITRAIRRVPESRLIAPLESIILPVAERLRFQEADNPITELYINLLARAMDGERVGEAHPAFIWVISQLTPDEAVLLSELSKNKYTLALEFGEECRAPAPHEIEEALDRRALSTELRETAKAIIFPREVLNQPDMFDIFLRHLTDLGLVKHNVELSERREYSKFLGPTSDTPAIHFIRLSGFGRLFYKACVSRAAG